MNAIILHLHLAWHTLTDVVVFRAYWKRKKIARAKFNPNLGGLFRGSLLSGGSKITPCLKLVGVMIET